MSPPGRPVTPSLRQVGALALPVAGLAGATGGAASVLASRAVGIRRHPRYRHRLLAVEDGMALLGRHRETERPGTYGLLAPGTHAVIGDVVAVAGGVVRRPILRVDEGEVRPGRVALDHVHVGDPRAAFGIDFEALELPGACGSLPTWILPGGDTWVLLCHGLGGSLRSSLSFLPFLHAAGHSLLVASYRNDPGAGQSPDRRYHLGADEWKDLELAMALALERGARRLVLFGWSLGGAVALQALERSRHAGAVAGLVLDSPVLCWRRVLRHVGRRAKVPSPLVTLALRLVERRIGARLDAFDWLARAGELTVPILDFHGETDPTVPFSTSQDLARRRPDLVELVAVPGAGHVGSWNVDPDGYARRITDFVAATAGPAATHGGSRAGRATPAID